MCKRVKLKLSFASYRIFQNKQTGKRLLQQPARCLEMMTFCARPYPLHISRMGKTLPLRVQTEAMPFPVVLALLHYVLRLQ